MVLEKTDKHKIVEEYKAHSKDTGSPSVQIALITGRINTLADHFKKFPKDFQSRRGLLRLVSQRRRLLDYLRKRTVKEYEALIKKLNIRK